MDVSPYEKEMDGFITFNLVPLFCEKKKIKKKQNGVGFLALFFFVLILVSCDKELQWFARSPTCKCRS